MWRMARGCPSCKAELSEASIVEALQAARCSSCGALVDLRSGGVVRFTPVRDAAAIAQPESWAVDEGSGRFSVRWRWFSAGALIMIPFTLFWNGILLGMGVGVSDGLKHPERLLLGLAVPHVWIGFALAYATVASLLNRTEITLEEAHLVVRHGPLPWLGNRRIPVGELEQLFVVERRSRGTRYELCALLRDGKKKVLLSGLDSEDKARFLEARLEAVLGIVDRPVAGELRR
jgi:hypothetical protein